MLFTGVVSFPAVLAFLKLQHPEFIAMVAVGAYNRKAVAVLAPYTGAQFEYLKRHEYIRYRYS